MPDRGNRVLYKQVVPPMEGNENATENHFMTLEFARHPRGRGIEVNIRAWLVNREPDGNLPKSAWTYTCSLDVGRPLTRKAFARNAAGDLIHYWWWDQEGWQAENLTQYANIGNDFRIASDPVVVNLWSGGTPTQHAFARNVAGDLIHYWWWLQDGWQAEDLTHYANIGNGFRIAGDPLVVNLESGDMPTQHAFARNVNGDLIHYWWWAQQGWRAENLTQYANIGDAFRVASDPTVIDLESGGMPTQHAFARDADLKLVHYWWSAQGGWQAENLTQYANIGNDFESPATPSWSTSGVAVRPPNMPSLVMWLGP